MSPDGEEVYFTEADVDAVLILDRATNEIITRIPVGASPHHPLFTPDGQVVDKEGNESVGRETSSPM